MIEVEAPEYGNRTERQVLHGFTCPKCLGSGMYIDHGVIHQWDREMRCERCGGSGLLRALVEISWEGEHLIPGPSPQGEGRKRDR